MLYRRKSMERILNELEADYQDGKMDKKVYEILRKQALLQMRSKTNY